MAIKESALSLITSIAQGDWVRAVTSAGASRRVTVANLAKAIVESYTGSSLAGSNQSVKAAIDSLNSKTKTVTGTTDSNGFLDLGLPYNSAIPLSVQSLTVNGVARYPFFYQFLMRGGNDATTISLQCKQWNGTLYTGSVTAVVVYQSY